METAKALYLWGITLVSMGLAGCNLLQPFEREPSSGMTQVRIASPNAVTPLDLFEHLKGMNPMELDGLGDGQVSVLGAPMGGGIMVYAVNQNDLTTTGLRYTSESDSTVFSLPNGPYKFYVIGYEAAGLASTTNGPQCGFATDAGNTLVNLNGGSKTLFAGLQIKGAGGPCTASAFSGFGYSTANFLQFEAFACNSAGYVGATSGSSNCTSNQSVDIAGGSLRVRMPALGPNGAIKNAGPSSPCKTLTTSAALTTGIYVPPGPGSNNPAIPVHIDVYSDVSCGTFLRTYLMNGGLGVAVTHAKAFAYSGTMIRVYLEDF